MNRNATRSADIRPLKQRKSGTDSLQNLFDALMKEFPSDLRPYDWFNSPRHPESNYPPTNIYTSEDGETVTIEMAMAGFKKDDIEVEFLADRSLTIRAKIEEDESLESKYFLKRGIATRAFEKSFRISQYTEVTSCEMENGLLVIQLVRNVPEREKPKLLDIK